MANECLIPERRPPQTVMAQRAAAWALHFRPFVARTPAAPVLDAVAVEAAFIKTRSFAGRGRQEQCFWCSKCQAIRCSVVGFVGIGCCTCQAALSFM